jgi:hypothetical protein
MSINRDETNKACLMVIALYNAAVEMEHLGVYADAADQYGEALQVCVATRCADVSYARSAR